MKQIMCTTLSGNWKLNPSTKEEALTLGKEIAASITAESPSVDVALFVPYVFIESAMGVVDGKLSIGAEVRSSIELYWHHCMIYQRQISFIKYLMPA